MVDVGWWMSDGKTFDNSFLAPGGHAGLLFVHAGKKSKDNLALDSGLYTLDSLLIHSGNPKLGRFFFGGRR